MLKIYINNEEVVANNDFTINKHMLNTPSVILNNVCPKEWKENKDYSSFYHPQDYSKCKIQDETYIPAEPGTYTTINGTATIQNVSASKLQEVLQLDGDTSQSGTPTPTTPQPINVVSGRQTFTTVGKNLYDTSTSVNGYVNNSGSVVLDYKNLLTDYIKLTSGSKYTISVNTTFGNIGYAYFDSNKTYVSRQNNNNKQSITLTIPNNVNYIRIWFNKDGATDMTPTNILQYQPMVELGESRTTYEAYKGQSYEINLGKQLLDLKNGTYTATNGITATVENGEITLNGTSTEIGFVQIDLNTRYNLEKNIPYTVSANNSVANADVRIRLDNNGNLDTTLSSINASRTITYNNETLLYTKVAIRVASGITLTNYKFRPMLEKGSVATSYAPYKTPIELCKIGNYTDHIFKAVDGDNVYDNLSSETKETLTYGGWYLEKQIGKVVLKGTGETYSYNGTAGDLSEFTYTPTTPKAYGQLNMISNYFPCTTTNTERILGRDNNGTIYFRILTSTASTTQQFQTWLSTHNTSLYYELATPTYTEITDEELLTQINSIKLIEGLNNVSITSPYLATPIYIHYNYVNEETVVDLLFCGIVKNSGKISLNPREPHLTTLQILDFKDFLSSGELDGFVIYQKTILEAIQMVIGNIQDYGFVLGNVNILNPNEVIGAYSTKDKTAYDVFNYLADITQSRWTTRMIDENTVAIDFYDPTLMVEGTAIDYTQSYFENNLIDDMKYNYGTNNYRNKQVMTSNQVYSNISQAQTIVANGYQTQFPTEQPIGKINSITANNIPMTFSTFNEKDMGYVADFYYNPGDNYIESDDLRSTGEIIVIDYVAIVEGRQIITNPLEIDRIKDSTGRKGIVSRYETRNDATTSTELQKIGESYIKYKGTPEIVLTIDSRKNLWEVGQRVQFNAPIEELETEYMVRTKKINYIVSVDTLFYTYELVSSFNSETEINYFDNQRAKSKGNIGEGEYISRNIDIESSANIIFYDTDMTEVQITGDNTLNSILNSPFED